jgi:hypothetical protein
MPSSRPLLSAVFGLACAGCSGVSAPALPEVPTLVPDAASPRIVGSPTEVYERVARGALGCWFGPSGPLKADYLYHAEADPPGKGGKAEIVVHVRDRTSDNQKGLRAYRIAIAPDNGTTTLVTENLKLPDDQAKNMDADALRWAAGSFGCRDADTNGWSETQATQPPAAGKPKPATGNR